MEGSKEHIKSNNKGKDLFALLFSCIVAGFLIKLPDLFNIGLDEDLFFRKFGGLILFGGLSLYTILHGGLSTLKNKLLACCSILIPALYMFLLTPMGESQSINLAYMHIPLIMWGFYGMVYMDYDVWNNKKRIEYLSHIGDILAFSAIILLVGGVLSIISIGLFEAIGMNISDFILNYVSYWAFVAVPIIASFIVRNFPPVRNRIAPLIAYVFSPLALITLLIFLANIPFSEKAINNDRSFLLIFNLMILSVMALIVYAASGISSKRKNRFMEITLLTLTIVAILVDAYALYAIGFRILAFGISANKAAVAGSNLLIFVHLILILIDLIRINRGRASMDKVLNNVANYLPIYFIWTVLVAFTFPLIFSMQ